jgi:hypothetical protein
MKRVYMRQAALSILKHSSVYIIGIPVVNLSISFTPSLRNNFEVSGVPAEVWKPGYAFSLM